MTTAEHADTFAALDLGSNSFHLIIARRETDGALVVIDRVREMVRLAGGLDEHHRLHPQARARALECLARFGERLRGLSPRNVRIVGTNTLRKARANADFLDAAEAALDHRIEIVSGVEEARLIYLGVAHSLAGEGRRLVMDIGGGSTEFIAGEGGEPLHTASLAIGCVGHSEAHFGNGRLTRKAFDAAELAARIEIEPIEARFRDLGWLVALGASGTIKAVATTLHKSGWTQGDITVDGLDRLRKAMLDAGHVDALDLAGVKPERHAVFPGGVAILRAAFQALGIDTMRFAEGALREGILVDLPGRLAHADSRAASVARLARRFHVDTGQVARVRATAEYLFEQMRATWRLDEECLWMLRWAAELHEIGLDMAHSGHHKHGAYIVDNSDLAGFARAEQRQLAALVRAHRRKLSNDLPEGFGEPDATRLQRLAIVLRLAVLLHRSRSETGLPMIECGAGEATVELRFHAGWLDEHPLTQADLAQERTYLEQVGVELRFFDTDTA